MKKSTEKFIYWTPRILSIGFIIFLALMSLDVFTSTIGFWETLFALFMHNIPALTLLIILLIAWRYEIVGGIGYILGGLLYIILLIQNPFQWYYIAWAAQISGVAFIIGALFLVGWFNKRN